MAVLFLLLHFSLLFYIRQIMSSLFYKALCSCFGCQNLLRFPRLKDYCLFGILFFFLMLVLIGCQFLFIQLFQIQILILQKMNLSFSIFLIYQISYSDFIFMKLAKTNSSCNYFILDFSFRAHWLSSKSQVSLLNQPVWTSLLN